MSARSQALVPLSTEQQAAWRAVAETEKRRHQGNTLAEYPYACAFFRCLNGSRRISLSDLRFLALLQIVGGDKLIIPFC